MSESLRAVACPAYLINLPRDRARGEAMQRQAEALALPLQRVDAVYGRDLTPAQRDALYSAALNARHYHRPLSPGEIGCYASHLVVWQRMVEQGDALALVLEDDVLLSPGLPALLTAVAALPAGWDMIKLVGRDRERAEAAWPLAGDTRLIRYPRVPSLTGAYLLSQAGARKLLASRRPFYRPIDVDLRHWWESGLAVYGLQPYPIALAPSAADSTIGPRESRGDWRQRWRKLCGQWHYTWANRRARQAQALQPEPFAP